jgi:hypothetical protein
MGFICVGDPKEQMLIPIFHEEADLPLPAKARTLSYLLVMASSSY